jgi:Tfp pilus assembly protein PilO
LTQALFLIAAALAVAAGGFFFGVPGVVDSIPSLSAKRDRLKKQLDSLRQENNGIEAFRQKQTMYLERVQESKDQINTLREIVPDEQKTDEFTTMIRAAGTETGVHVQALEAQTLLRRDFYVEMPFTLQADGTYNSQLNFFNRLAQSQRIVSVSNLSLRPPAGQARGVSRIRPGEPLGATCQVTAYFNKPTQK